MPRGCDAQAILSSLLPKPSTDCSRCTHDHRRQWCMCNAAQFISESVTALGDIVAQHRPTCSAGLSPDRTPPYFPHGCPPDMRINAESDAGTASVFWSPPEGVAVLHDVKFGGSTCIAVVDADGVVATVISSSAPGTTLSLGTHEITYTATDSAFNHASCTFTVSWLFD